MAEVEIVAVMASPQHRYDGRPGAEVPEQEADRRSELAVRAGFGIVGDRYAGKPAHRDASVTVLAVESLEDLAAELGVPPFDPLLARRNVVLRGADVEALRGVTFTLGGVTCSAAGRPTPAAGWTSSSHRVPTAACAAAAVSAAAR